MVFSRTNLQFDLVQLRSELAQLFELISFHKESDQICLNHRSYAQGELFYDGVGASYSHDSSRWNFKECDFTEFHPRLKNSYFHEIFQRIQDSSPLSLGRMRICRLGPKRCYSLHSDRDVRFHIPLYTNSNSFLIFPEIGAYQMPADGGLYVTDTRQMHTAINGHNKEERLHIVISTDCQSRDKVKFSEFVI